MEKLPEKLKILFCGDVEGKFDCLFSRVENVNRKSGPFDLLLCVGNFFGINNKEFDKYKLGINKVPVPTYILGPNKIDHNHLFENVQLCENVFYLGKRGLYTSSGGVKIAYLSGRTSNETTLYQYNLEEVNALIDVCQRGNVEYRGVDILLTSEWPANVYNFDSNFQLKSNIQYDSELVAWLTLKLKPRYHISGLEGVYYERAPYRASTTSLQDSTIDIVTRFIALARVGNPEKQKWLYALNLLPIDRMQLKELVQKTTDETACPFNILELEPKLFKCKPKPQHNQYFYDMNAAEEPRKSQKAKRQKVQFDQNKCWFCLASPNVEKHLIITVGNLVYLALAKGGLVIDHFLICPVEHYQCILGQNEVFLDEVQQFKSAVSKYYASKGNVAVFFERNYKTSHMQIQAVPIPKQAQGDLLAIFKDEAEGHGFKLEELDSPNNLEQVLPAAVPYFVAELPNGMVLYTRIQKSMSFPINFGREVLASGPVLNMENRVEWKDCTLKKEQEEVLVQRVRKDFAPFDFNC